MKKITGIFILLISLSCNSSDTNQPSDNLSDKSKFADVTNVAVSGNDNEFTFRVEISSPDEGCEKYADWWEVISEDGELIYRRVLLHSHVNEQPFTRTGGPVTINEYDHVWVRAHMNSSGYGGKAFFGSVIDGFSEKDLDSGFATNLSKEDPLPQNCDF